MMTVLNLVLCARFSSGTGHYTQLVWAESEEIGCAVVYFKVGKYVF